MKYQVEFRVPRTAQVGQYGAKLEDGGASMIVEAIEEKIEQGGDGRFFVRLHSYDGQADYDHLDRHQTMQSLLGRRVRVTVEAID